MRPIPLALAGLLLAAVPALASAAQDRGRAPQSAGTGAAARQAGVEAAPGHGTAALRAAPMRGRVVVSRDRRSAVASSGPEVATAAACTREAGAARCRAGARGWTQGLSPAAGVQAAGCPAGTVATLATGHADVVRCVPL